MLNIDHVNNDIKNESDVSVLGYEWSGDTANSTPAEIFLGGVSNERLTINPSSVLGFEMMIVARDNTSGDCACYTATGAIKRDGAGNTALLATVTPTVVHEDDTSWNVSITADDTNEALIITVTGDATNTVRWTAFLTGKLVESAF